MCFDHLLTCSMITHDKISITVIFDARYSAIEHEICTEKSTNR